MKSIALTILIIFSMAISINAQQNGFFELSAKNSFGEEMDLSVFKGKKVLVVNTASKCGFTPQYEGLEKLYQKYKDNNFVIIAFPANNFMNQEPGSNEDIRSFCDSKYNISFQLMSKISVKGNNKHAVYNWLTEKEKNGVKNSRVRWNFQKYMINPDGTLYDYVKPKVKPFDKKIVNWIEDE